MATKSISQLDTQATANETDLFEVAIVDQNSASGYASKKESAAAIADAIVGEYQYPLRITGTTAKTIAGAINELKNLVDLLPQFAIEVVQTLPVSDISTTTIYLVPASDPEQGNYYEEYIYVNNAWELVGTTAVDLSGYYTSAQVDTLLAAKADSASLATVATSGAYSDLSGKPTIDTALDTTSTNAVENRAVAGAINSIKSDITVEGSASGDIATFVDGSDNPLKELKISIVAQQSGSGDPSPTNVRPITGWTGAVVNITRKNLLDYNAIKKITYNAQSNIRWGWEFNIPATYTISAVPLSDYIFAKKINANGTYGEGIYVSIPTEGITRNPYTVTISAGERFLVYSAVSGSETKERALDSVNRSHPQLEVGSVGTSYQPYNGTTYSISWQTEAGTIYGGLLNVKTGELTVTYALCHLDENTSWSKGDSQTTGGFNRFYYSPTPTMKSGSAQNGLCDKFPIGNVSSSVPVVVLGYNNTAIQVLSTANDTTEFASEMESLGGIDVVYPLATPVTYQLTPVEIRSLLGVNNVFADCGAITELKYIRDLNLCINDIIARIEALEGASNSRSLSVSPTLTKSLTSELDTAEGKTEEETEEETKEEAQNER